MVFNVSEMSAVSSGALLVSGKCLGVAIERAQQSIKEAAEGGQTGELRNHLLSLGFTAV